VEFSIRKINIIWDFKTWFDPQLVGMKFHTRPLIYKYTSYDYKSYKLSKNTTEPTYTQRKQQKQQDKSTKNIRNNKNNDKQPITKIYHSYHDKLKKIKFTRVQDRFLTGCPEGTPDLLRPSAIDDELKKSSYKALSIFPALANSSIQQHLAAFIKSMETAYLANYPFFPEEEEEVSNIAAWYDDRTLDDLETLSLSILDDSKSSSKIKIELWISHRWLLNTRFKCDYDNYTSELKHLPTFHCKRCNTNCCLFCINSNNFVNCITHNSNKQKNTVEKLKVFNL